MEEIGDIMKKLIYILIIVLLLVPIVAYGENEIGEEFVSYSERGTVLDATKSILDPEIDPENPIQHVKVRIDSGKYKGEVLEIYNVLSDNEIYNIFVEKGQKVVLMVEEYSEGDIEVYVADYYRSNYLLYLTIAFIGLIILIGKGKGVKAVVSLTITIVSILYILLPLMLKGVNPIPISVAIAVVVTIITMFLVGGINSKSISAIIGTSVGVIIAGLISYYIGNKAYLTGLSAQEATMLMYIPQDVLFNFKNLLFAGIILGALGAAMDVGISVASSIEEIHRANPTLSRKQLFNAGMNVGKDVMGTMTNTLILAYTGSSIPLLLLFMAYETSVIKILNLDIIATEIVRSLSGSIGLVLTIPITAFVASYLTKSSTKREADIIE